MRMKEGKAQVFPYSFDNGKAAKESAWHSAYEG